MVERNESGLKLSKTRLPYIDILKGIGIILVILGHMIPRGALWNTIYGFHMPLFIFCSGLFEKEQLYWARLVKLLLHYLGLAALGTGIYFLLYEFGNIYYVKQSIFNVLVGGFSPGYGIYPVEALWFIPCLLLMILLYHGVCLIPVPILRHLSIAAGAMLGAMLTQYRNELSMLFSLDVCLLLMPFFYIGSLLKGKMHALADMRSGIILLAAVCASVLYFLCAQWNGEVNIYRGLFGHSLSTYYFCAALGIFLLLALSVLLHRYTVFISKILQHLGKHTLIMMGTHQLIILLLQDKLRIQGLLLPAVVLISWGVSKGLQMTIGLICNRRKERNDRKISIPRT